MAVDVEEAGIATDLSAAYLSVRRATEALGEPLEAEDYVIQSMPDASPVKWHLAHTTWFFETFLLTPLVERYAPFDPAYAYLFNSYYEAVGPRHPRPQRGLLSRPSVAEIAVSPSPVTSAALNGAPSMSTTWPCTSRCPPSAPT